MKGKNLIKGMIPLAALALVACAQNQQVASEEQQTAVEQPVATVEHREPEAAQLVQEEEPKVAGPDYSTLNPVPISFETLAVSLDETDQQVFDAVNDRILGAERITVRGYCDRAQVENAREVAIERGVTVRNELVRRGFDPNRIRIRYSTEIPDKHAVEFELHPGA